MCDTNSEYRPGDNYISPDNTKLLATVKEALKGLSHEDLVALASRILSPVFMDEFRDDLYELADYK